MHVANSWYMSYVMSAHKLFGAEVVRWLAYAQCAATLGARAHYLIDIPAGLLLAEVCARLMFLPMERNNTFSQPALLGVGGLCSARACSCFPLRDLRLARSNHWVGWPCEHSERLRVAASTWLFVQDMSSHRLWNGWAKLENLLRLGLRKFITTGPRLTRARPGSKSRNQQSPLRSQSGRQMIVQFQEQAFIV